MHSDQLLLQYLQVAPGHLVALYFQWFLALRGLQECPTREAGKWNKVEDSHILLLVNGTQLSQNNNKYHHYTLSFCHQDSRSDGAFLFPTTKHGKKFVFVFLSLHPIRYNYFKFKIFLCLMNPDPCRWSYGKKSGSEIEKLSILFLLGSFGEGSAASEESLHYSKFGCWGKVL